MVLSTAYVTCGGCDKQQAGDGTQGCSASLEIAKARISAASAHDSLLARAAILMVTVEQEQPGIIFHEHNPDSQFKSLSLNRDLVVKYINQSFVRFLKEGRGSLLFRDGSVQL